jgi:cytochrome c oxidase cbb3-type subunit 4
MEYETLLTIQGYTKIGFITLVFIVFYSYAYSIYKRDRSGERDFESY